MKRRLLRRAGFHVLRVSARALALGGMPTLRWAGEAFGAWHYRLGARKRHELLRQLQTVFPGGPPGGDNLKGALREAYRINDRAILEILAAYSGAVAPAELAAFCQVRRTEALDEALSEGRGAVLLGMHMGNGVAMAIHLAARGYPIHVVYRESNKITPDFFRNGIRNQGLEAIAAAPPAHAVRRMLAALKANQVIFILMDQASKRGGVAVEFLGKQLHLPPGPVELARRTGASIVPALLCGVDERWHFRLADPIRMDRSRELGQEVKILSDIMQSHILAHPQWWSWHQRRWWRHPFTTDAPPRTERPDDHS